MLFNSIAFLIFFPLVTLIYFVLPHRWRWALLLVASCIFYISFIPVYIFILAVTIAIDYTAGIWIERSEGTRRRTWLIISIISTCLVLFVFKYFNFFNGSVRSIASLLHLNYPVPVLDIILPIGLSFHTFQSLSYVVEVYRGKQKAEHNFGIYSLYVMFYPQLVAGPIERPQNLLHQFYEKHEWDYHRVARGLQLMLWGLFKKVVIADRLAVIVNTVYNNPHRYQGLPLVIGTVLFAFQIFCDFSGYSDIAIGSAEVMGFKLMTNFNRPYFSRSIVEFWKRWHISLSTWFRDYVYIPLGGNRVSLPRWQLNLFITFLISGLWHGAKWTFVIWGALNGLYMLASVGTIEARKKIVEATGIAAFPRIHHAIQIMMTFTLVCFGWIFFRAHTFTDALYISTHLFSSWNISAVSKIGELGLNPYDLICALMVIGFLLLVQTIQHRYGSVRTMVGDNPIWVRWPLWYALILSVVLMGFYANPQAFIYFQF
ncbi:MAG: MBOAT family O-acyltransferase [Endomicrobiales bacterium]|jgi:D-alanyl-lipoteichoic acid acyltransferase DltB (MBOAT superfamily)